MQRALRLLETVSSHPDGAPAKQLAREAGLPLPTAYHLLRTLAHEDYLRREKGVFILGDAVERLAIGGALQNRRTTLVDLLAHRRDAIGGAVYFAVCRESEIEIVAVAESPYAPDVAEWRTLLERLASTERMQPVLERQEYALGTGCAAI